MTVSCWSTVKIIARSFPGEFSLRSTKQAYRAVFATAHKYIVEQCLVVAAYTDGPAASDGFDDLDGP